MKLDQDVSFGAVGDLGFGHSVGRSIERYGVDWPFELMTSSLRDVDLLFGNFEAVFAPPDSTKGDLDPRGLIVDESARGLATSLRRAGFDILNLAANHALDAGERGMLFTRQLLEDANLVTAGVGIDQAQARRPAIVEHGGLVFAFLCYCEDSNYSLGKRGASYAYYEVDSVIADIDAIRDEVDVVVVSVHADLEFLPTPSLSRVREFRSISLAGADIVLGHHPHVPQGCELIDGRLIVYSLGNFVFPAHSFPYIAEHLPATSYSYLLICRIDKHGVQSYSRLPVVIDRPPNERPRPATGREKKMIEDHLEQLDGYLRDESFLRRTWEQAAMHKFSEALSLVAGYHAPAIPRWKRRLARLLGIPTAQRNSSFDMDFLLEDLVGRLCLTAENRRWMQEILQMASDRWGARNAASNDDLHSPHFQLNRRYRKQ